MAYYRTCPDCGSNLDPGEECGCKRKTARAATRTVIQRNTLNINKHILPQNQGKVKERMKNEL